MINHLLVIRFSALGDVAMTVPLLRQLAYRYPELQITVLSRRQYADIFTYLPENIHFAGADLKGIHKGIKGLNKLLHDIDYKQFDAVADFHNVIRSRYLDFRFRLAGKRVAIINKGRYQKWQLTRRYCKHMQPLPTVFDRQTDVLRSLGFEFDNTVSPLINVGIGIGIAPFAAHKGKTYPLDKMEEVIRLLNSKTDEPIFLFGAKGKEQKLLQRFEDKYSKVANIAGKMSLNEELNIMNALRVMVSMDSANMHLASLYDIRVVSIWGATHPYAGFLGYGQKPSDCIQIELPCRPCSIFGNKPCRYGDYHCMTDINPEYIVNKILDEE